MLNIYKGKILVNLFFYVRPLNLVDELDRYYYVDYYSYKYPHSGGAI